MDRLAANSVFYIHQNKAKFYFIISILRTLHKCSTKKNIHIQ